MLSRFLEERLPAEPSQMTLCYALVTVAPHAHVVTDRDLNINLNR